MFQIRRSFRLAVLTPGGSKVRLVIFARIEQSMEMDDEIAHVRIIDGLLRLGPPGCMCGSVVWKYADGLDLFEVFEGRVLEIDKFAAKDDMEQLRLTAV
jgi:hypothetical protein